MLTIYKYGIKIADKFSIIMPEGSKVLCVQTQHDNPYMWVLTDPEKQQSDHLFYLRGTGHDCSDMDDKQYVGTFQLNRYGTSVFHLFQEP